MSAHAFLLTADLDEGDETLHTAARRMILSTGVLQSAGCNGEIRAGKVPPLHHGRFPDERVALIGRLMIYAAWRSTAIARLQAAAQFAGIYTWVVKGIDEATAQKMDHALARQLGYLGVLAVDLEDKMHRLFLHDLLDLQYRINGRVCTVLKPSAPDDAEIEALGREGFVVVRESPPPRPAHAAGGVAFFHR